MIRTFPILDFYPSSISYTSRPKSLVAGTQSTGITDINRDIYVDTPFIYEIEYKNITKAQSNRITDFFNVVRTNYPFIFFVHYKPIVVNFVSHIKISQDVYQRYSLSFSIENFYGDTEIYGSNNLLNDVINSSQLPFNDFKNVFSAIKSASTEELIVNTCYWNLDLSTDDYALEIELFIFSGTTPWIATSMNNFATVQQNYSIPPQKLKRGYNAIFFRYYDFEPYLVLFTQPSETSTFSLNISLIRT